MRAPLSLELKYAADRVLDRSIGDLIRELRKLSDAQIERILAYQGEHGVRFGEAARARLQSAGRNPDAIRSAGSHFRCGQAFCECAACRGESNRSAAGWHHHRIQF